MSTHLTTVVQQVRSRFRRLTANDVLLFWTSYPSIYSTGRHSLSGDGGAFETSGATSPTAAAAAAVARNSSLSRAFSSLTATNEGIAWPAAGATDGVLSFGRFAVAVCRLMLCSTCSDLAADPEKNTK